jgi:hypothetical protein
VGVDEAIGWDEGVPQMSLGEKAILTMSGYDYHFFCSWVCDVDADVD